jgi:hypothetical protein
MSVDITQHEFQNVVAESLLDAPIVAQFTHEGNFGNVPYPEGSEGQESVFDDAIDLLNEGLEDHKADGDFFYAVARAGQENSEEDVDYELERQEDLVLSAEEKILRRMERDEQREPVVETREPHRQPEQRQPEQVQTFTPESVETAVQALDATVRQHGLNDPPSANEFASAFCESLGTDVYKSGVNVEALGGTMAKASLSAMQVYEAAKGDLSIIPPVPEASAKAFSHDLLRSIGIDPRAVQVDESLLANTVMQGALSFLHTYQSYGGKVTDFAKLNDGALSEQFFGNFLRAFGIEGAVDRASAIRFADAGGKYLLSMIDKINGINARNAEAQQKTARGKSRGQRVPARFREGLKGSKAPRFETNRDVFGESLMDAAISRNL